jgi:hypothetical protein
MTDSGWFYQDKLPTIHAVTVLVSRAAAEAEPGPALKALALRLVQLYLSDDEILADATYHDRLALALEGDENPDFVVWKVGVNFFGAQGDQRWWHDHRIPGGIAFSMNSVGHMTRTRLQKAMSTNPKLLSAAPADKLVDFAFYFAMKTIHGASYGPRPGTNLLPRDAQCPIPEEERARVLKDMSEYNECYYLGHYHTDVTVPTSYFDTAVDRPKGNEDLTLLFTYLHDQSDEDYGLMGIGGGLSVDEIQAAFGWEE